MTPDFIIELRKHIGHAELWLIGVTVIVVRGDDGAEEVCWSAAQMTAGGRR